MLSQEEARALALRAQGFGVPYAEPPEVLRTLGVIQLDSVSTVARSHELAVYSRFGSYEASTVNIGVREEFADVYDHVIARITAEGPLSAADFGGERQGAAGWWNHKPAKRVLEDLFDQGELACADRTEGFARVYDLAERVVPAHVNRVDPSRAAAARELLIAGLRGVAYALPEVLDGPRDVPVHRPVFLSPLDNLLWGRGRIRRLFGFEHTFEIYIPEARRRYGYYVLPLLAKGRLGGRADLKLDRTQGVLRVKGLWLEDAVADDPSCAQNAAAALRDLARHLGAQAIELSRDRGGPPAQVSAVSALLADASPPSRFSRQYRMFRAPRPAKADQTTLK